MSVHRHRGRRLVARFKVFAVAATLGLAAYGITLVLVRLGAALGVN